MVFGSDDTEGLSVRSQIKSNEVSLCSPLYFWCFYSNNAYPEAEVHRLCNGIVHLPLFSKLFDWHACIHCYYPPLVFSNDPRM